MVQSSKFWRGIIIYIIVCAVVHLIITSSMIFCLYNGRYLNKSIQSADIHLTIINFQRLCSWIQYCLIFVYGLTSFTCNCRRINYIITQFEFTYDCSFV